MKFCISFNGKPLIFNDIHSILTKVDFPDCKENELLLVLKMDINGNTFSLLSPDKIPIGYLANKKIFNYEFLLNLLQSGASNKVLLDAINEITELNKINRNTVMLAIYFYLSDASMSVTQLADWLIESGVTSEDAESLAMSIYLARVERQEDNLDFIFQDSGIFNLSLPVFHVVHIINSVDSFFSKSYIQDKTRFLFDEYQQYFNFSGDKNRVYYYCGDIPETSFLVEDHNHLILGLSCRLSEVMSICEFSAPQFYAFIKYHSSFSERTYRSLAGFLEEFYSEFIQLVNESGIKCSLKLLDNQNKTIAINLQNCIFPLGFNFAIPGYLPVFMNVEKAHQSVV